MKRYFFLLLLFPQIALADFVASAGLVGGKLQSEQESTNGKPIIDASTYIGFRGEAEFGHPFATLFASFEVGRGSAKTQYDFQNDDVPSDQATVNDLDTSLIMSRASAGLRLRLIKLKTFRLYAGGGGEYGIMNLTYDKEHFKSKNAGSSNGFEETETQNFRGGFLQAGMEFIIDNDSGFRVQVQKDYFKTDEFETLNEKKIKFSPVTFSVTFMQYIDT